MFGIPFLITVWAFFGDSILRYSGIDGALLGKVTERCGLKKSLDEGTSLDEKIFYFTS